MAKRKPGNYKGGKTKVECPNCGERDTQKMVTGMRRAYAECHCGCCFDVETGACFMRQERR